MATLDPLFEGAKVTATSVFTRSERLAYLGICSPLALPAVVLPFSRALLSTPAGLAYSLISTLCFGVVCIALAGAAAERRVVFDANDRTIGVFRRSWWRNESVRVIPFSAVRSVGLARRPSDDGLYCLAVLRLNGRPFPYHLWVKKAPYGLSAPDRPRALPTEEESTMARLVQLTGLPREDNAAFGWIDG